METSYFLGANTASGFLSLYDGFCRGEGDYLHIVKGGPGTGKSGFMRAIGREAARRGLDVEYVRCSGDPASLDGVYLPELHMGWCDGTAPHVAEPGIFGADCDYVNLGAFCRTPLSSADAERAHALTTAYKEKYARAYALLAAAKSATLKFLDSMREVCNKQLQNIEDIGNGFIPEEKAAAEAAAAEAAAQAAAQAAARAAAQAAAPAPSIDDAVRSIERSVSRIQPEESVNIDISPAIDVPAKPESRLDSTQPFSF